MGRSSWARDSQDLLEGAGTVQQAYNQSMCNWTSGIHCHLTATRLHFGVMG